MAAGIGRMANRIFINRLFVGVMADNFIASQVKCGVANGGGAS